MVESRGGHGVHVHGQYDVFRPVHRWIWFGADGSGMIREIAGPYSFYTPEGKTRWEAAGSPALREGLSDDVYGPGELSGIACRQAAAGQGAPAPAEAVFEARALRALDDVSRLLGETMLPTQVRQSAYETARRIPGVKALTAVADQLGRPGHGLAELDGNSNHRELVFDDDYQLLGYQLTVLNVDWDYAPRGTVVSWSAYLARQWAEHLPHDAPVVPDHN